MSLEDMMNELLSQASSAASQKLKEAAEYREAMLESARTEAGTVTRQYTDRLRAEGERMRHEASREAEIEVAKARGAMMKKVLEQTYAGVLGIILGKEKRSGYMPMFVEKAGRELGGGTIHARSEDAPYARKMTSFEVREDLASSAGIIAESADGTVLIDLTVETLLGDFWQKNLALAYGILFG